MAVKRSVPYKRQHEEMPAWVWSWCDSSNFGRLKLLCVEELIMHCESGIAASGGHPAPPSKMFVFLVEEMRFLDDIVNRGLEISILAYFGTAGVHVLQTQ